MNERKNPFIKIVAYDSYTKNGNLFYAPEAIWLISLNFDKKKIIFL